MKTIQFNTLGAAIRALRTGEAGDATVRVVFDASNPFPGKENKRRKKSPYSSPYKDVGLSANMTHEKRKKEPPIEYPTARDLKRNRNKKSKRTYFYK